MITPETIRAIISQASASGSRSTALQPLGWLSGILTSGLILAASFGAPVWVLVSFAVMLCSTVGIYLSGYVYYAIKNPDALRSEKFTLSKMAIEKNLIGDNEAGLMEIDEFGTDSMSLALPNKMEGEN